MQNNLPPVHAVTLAAKLGDVLDKMPFNIVGRGMVCRLFPDAKVIIVIRGPRDSCLSCFMRPFMPSQTNMHLMSLESAARLYAGVMELWLHYRSSWQLLFIKVRYEDLVADLEAVARWIIGFIGAPWDDGVLDYFEHARIRNMGPRVTVLLLRQFIPDRSALGTLPGPFRAAHGYTQSIS